MIMQQLAKVVALFGIFFAFYFFWRKVKEEHFDEYRIFDHFFSSFILAWILSRIGFFIIHFSSFQDNLLQIIDLYHKPGLLWLLLIPIWALSFYRKVKTTAARDAFIALDFWSVFVSMAAVAMGLYWFLASSHLGRSTELLVGVQFAGVFEKHHPVQLYHAVCFLILSFFLLHAEYRYRNYAWYKQRGNARPGFLFASFTIASGIILLLMRLFQDSQIILGSIALDPLLAIIFILAGFGLMLERAGFLQLQRKRKANNVPEDFLKD